MENNSRSNSIECPYCDKTSKDANGLWMHVKSKHPDRKKFHPKPMAEDDEPSMGDMFRVLKEDDKRRRSENLSNADPKGWTIHHETHWSQVLLGERIDYWPSRNKFRWRKKTHTGDVIGFMNNQMKKFLRDE